MIATKLSPELRGIQDAARAYEAQGYKVVLEPKEADLPEPLTMFRPDLVAIGPDETVVVEVKSRESLAGSDYIPQLAAAVAKLPKWRLDLVVVGPEPLEGQYPIDLAQLRRRLSAADRLLLVGDDDAAVLVLWSVVEGVLRLIARQAELDLRSDSPSTLVRDLATLGYLEREDYKTLQAAIGARNAIVHGFSSHSADAGLAGKLYEVALRLLSQLSDPTNGAVPGDQGQK